MGYLHYVKPLSCEVSPDIDSPVKVMADCVNNHCTLKLFADCQYTVNSTLGAGKDDCRALGIAEQGVRQGRGDPNRGRTAQFKVTTNQGFTNNLTLELTFLQKLVILQHFSINDKMHTIVCCLPFRMNKF